MEKLVKANKTHKCYMCDGEIVKGELYRDFNLRLPVYKVCEGYDSSDPDAPEIQTGVQFQKFKGHNYNCLAPFECQIGNHKFEFFSGMCGDQRITEDCYMCTECCEIQYEKPDMYDLQERDLKNIANTGHSNNNSYA